MPGKRYQKIVTAKGTELVLVSGTHQWSPASKLTLVAQQLPWGETVFMTAEKAKPPAPPKPLKAKKHAAWGRWSEEDRCYYPATPRPNRRVLRVPLKLGKKK
jgi:hypothetical protein